MANQSEDLSSEEFLDLMGRAYIFTKLLEENEKEFG